MKLIKLNSYLKNFKRININFSYFIAISLLLHFFLFGAMHLTVHLTAKKNKINSIEITFADLEIEKSKTINPHSIVESDSQNANNNLSNNAKFLSEKSNTVKKETRAKNGNDFRNVPKSAKTQSAKKYLAVSQSKLFENGFDAYASINKKSALELQQYENRTTEASTTNDNLAKIEDDLMTRLNTKEYKYFGYYSRIKKQLNQWWVPNVQQKFTKMARQGRTIATEDNKVTKLVIILNDVGHLVNVQILAESGIRDLDDAAIEAFRSAAPFPNPPKGMIDSDGTVKIRWDCVVES